MKTARLMAGWLVLCLCGAAAAGAPELITRIRQQRYHAAAELLKAGADPNARDNHGWTALHHAAGLGLLQCVGLLIEAGADLEAADELKVRPLHRAVVNGHRAVVERLLDAGADMSATDLEGKTALHMAAQAGQLDVARLLLDRGAPVNPVDEHDQTPLEYAKSSTGRRRVDLVGLLRRAGGKPGRYVKAMALYRKRKAGELPRCRGYLDTVWGMNRQQVIDVQPDVQPVKGNRDLVLRTEVAGLDANVFFQLPEGLLNGAVVVFSAPRVYGDNAKVLADYERLVELLSHKYGEPYDRKRVWKTASNSYRLAESTAVGSGLLTLQTTWETDWTQIVLTCLGDSGQPRITLAYKAVVKVGAEKKAIDRDALDDL